MIPGFKKSALTWNDILMYLSLIGRHLRLMVLLVCFSLMMGLTFYVYAKPVYYAKALIGRDSFALPVDTDTVYGPSQIQYHISAPHIIQRALRTLGINEDWDDIQRHHVKKIQTSMTSVGDVELHIWPHNKGLLYTLPEALLESYQDYVREQRAKTRAKAVDRWDRERVLIMEKINHLSQLNYDFEQEQDLLRLEMELRDLKRIPPMISFTNHKLQVFENYQEQLQRPGLTTEEKLALLYNLDTDIGLRIGQIIENPTGTTMASTGTKLEDHFVVTPSMVNRDIHRWQEFVRRKKEIVAEMKKLEQKYLPGHPLMATRIQEIEDLDQALELELDDALTRFNREYLRIRDNKASLAKKLPQYEEVKRRHDRLENEHKQRNAGQLAWSGLYSTISKSLAEMEWGSDRQRHRYQYLGLWEVKELPISPHRLKLDIYSLAVGLGMAIGVPLLLEYLDHTISHVEQAEDQFQLRALGIVPRVLEGSLVEGTKTNVIDKSSERHLLENFRVIRTNLLSNSVTEEPPKIIMVASALPQEGKSLVSSNLALSFSQMGDKTLIIDADLRRGRLHRAFRAKSSPGLSHVLTGEKTLEECIRPTKTENLFILPYGKHVDGVTELLGSRSFVDTIAELRTTFDRVIIDTPPALGLSDAAMMHPHCDGIVMVIWSKRTSAKSLQMAINSLKDNGANFYGFVLNRLDLNDSTNYYNYYYYYQNYQVAETASS